MRRIGLLLTAALLTAEAGSPLSEEKRTLLELKRQKMHAEVSKLRNSWISPLQLSAGWQRSVNAGRFDGKSKKAGISMRQDIFRSGGIWYAVDYAKALGEAQALGIDIEEARQLESLYRLTLQFRRATLQLRQAELRLENRTIDADVVKERYRAGEADISELNRVMIAVDEAENQRISLENQRDNLRYELRKLYGEKSLANLKVPEIPLVDREDYLDRNLELLRYRMQIASDRAKYKAVRSGYLPRVTLNGNYGYSKFDGDFQSYSGAEYGYGIQLSMPLDINMKQDVEANRLTYLSSRVAAADRRKELASEYDRHIAAIEAAKRKIAVARRMHNRYDTLYRFTKREYRAGTKTAYDVRSLGNSLRIQEMEEQIRRLDIVIEKVALFFAMKR